MRLIPVFTLFLITIVSCRQVPEGTGFDEPPDPNPVPLVFWMQTEPGMHAAFGSTDKRYEYHYPPDTPGQKVWKGSAWRGERVNIQLKVWSTEPVTNVRVRCKGLSGGRGRSISGDNINIFPVRFLLTDEFLDGCGWRDHDTIQAYLASDMFDYDQPFNLEANTLRPVWLTIDVPPGSAPGEYSGEIEVSYKGGRKTQLPLNLRVYDLLLPPPQEWSFHLDLWQNPFAVARYYGVEPWSEEHWALLPPYLEMLAGAGQKCITASILHKPWGGQTYDHFESMIEWKHLGDGKWEYDYTVFDRWVELAGEAGITRQINCYSMVPWGNQVRYFDVASNDYITRTVVPGSAGYAELWAPFLKSFRDHLLVKGWLDRTLIAMDERGPEEMQGMISLLTDIAPEFKIALAGNYIEEINDHLFDLCVFIIPQIDIDLIAERVDRGMPTTFYTCCARPEHPNNFTFSPPAEQAWLGWHAASRGFTGYLRWAYNSWVEDPVRDSRFRTWPAGDTYQIYPGPRSSIRFERLREGIQDFEKIRILRELASDSGSPGVLKDLGNLLDKFTVEEIRETPAEFWLNRGREELNRLSLWAEHLQRQGVGDRL